MEKVGERAAARALTGIHSFMVYLALDIQQISWLLYDKNGRQLKNNSFAVGYKMVTKMDLYIKLEMDIWFVTMEKGTLPGLGRIAKSPLTIRNVQSVSTTLQ